MKKALLTGLFLLTLLFSFVGTAAADSSHTANLIGIDYENKGPVFTFQVSGRFTRAELKGFLHVQGGGEYGLFCTQVDETTVTCTTSRKVAAVKVVLSWGGFTFWAYVPNAPADQYCYSVWDWWDASDYQWTDVGPHCQDMSAEAGDVITYALPGLEGDFDSWAMFFDVDVSDECGGTVPYYGPAYYFPFCPEQAN